jgi:hypothetical protein
MRHVISVMVLALLVVPTIGISASAQTREALDCADVAAYLETVDTALAEQFHALVNDPDWLEGYGPAQERIDRWGSTDKPMDPDEIQPVLDYIGIAVPVLDAIDADDVPERMRNIHETAIDYWTAVPEMFASMVGHDPETIYAYLDNIDALTEQNMLAQITVRVECAETIAPYLEHERGIARLLASAEDGDFETLQSATEADLEGIGIFFLFFADYPEPMEIVIHKTESTPQIVTVEPESTPVD